MARHEISSRSSSMLGRLASSLRHRLSRLFARKSPGNFDEETGSWVDPDVILSPSDTVPRPPKPLVNNNCRQSHVVYSVVVNKVDTCNFAAKQQALSDAIAKAVTYFDKHFECRNKNCIKKVGEIIWTGVSCSQNPVCAFGAVLVRFRCEIEL